MRRSADLLGFMDQVLDLFESVGPDQFVGSSKSVRRHMKRIFREEADHRWLSTLNTIHWVKNPASLQKIIGKGRDELSATMSLPGKNLTKNYGEYELGLWIKGRITLAANNMHDLYSAGLSSYLSDPPTKDQIHRQQSSGINKLPLSAYSPYSAKKFKKWHDEEGAEATEEEILDEALLYREFPYVLDRKTWRPYSSRINEALVDNWRPLGVVVSGHLFWMFNSGKSNHTVMYAKGFAQRHQLPVYGPDLSIIWVPE